MEGCDCKEHVAQQPTGVEPAARAIAAVDRRHDIAAVREEERNHGAEQQPVRRGSSPANEDGTQEQCEKYEVRDGVRHADRPRRHGPVCHRVGCEERPAAHAGDQGEQAGVKVRAQVTDAPR